MAETANTSAGAADGFQTLDLEDMKDMAAPDRAGSAAPAAIAPGAEDASPETPSDPPAPIDTPGQEAAAGCIREPADQAPAAPPADATSTSFVLREINASGQDLQTGKAIESRLVLKAICAVVVVLALAGGVWLYAHRPQLSPSDDTATPALDPPSPQSATVAPGSTASPPDSADPFAWEAVLRDVDHLRHELLAKRDEILRLQQTYQEGVQELEEEAMRFVRRWGIDSLSAAMKKQEVALLLHSLQRRQGYSEGLGKPLRWIEQGSEELLYLKRRAILEYQIKDISEHVDIKSIAVDVKTAIKRYQPGVEQLSLTSGSLPAIPLEAIWRRILEQSRNLNITPDVIRSQEITDEVCSGNLGRLSELTSLSLKGARCLAESEARELFLNRLTDIPPAAAKKLAEWPGHWLCLNAINRISPELAGYVFAWPGERISLNGLSELPPDAGRNLAGWKGRQLELMGLRKPTGLGYLAQWEDAGGRLFVPDGIRREIDALRGSGQVRSVEKPEMRPQRR